MQQDYTKADIHSICHSLNSRNWNFILLIEKKLRGACRFKKFLLVFYVNIKNCINVRPNLIYFQPGV